MQLIRCLSVALATVLVAGCSSFTGNPSPSFARNAQWGVMPMVNYSQTPQAGERTEQILISVLGNKGLQPRVYTAKNDDQALFDDSERLDGALEWARAQKLDYLVTGSVEEWRYKNGLDGEPAVGLSLRVIEPASGRVLWSTSGARAGWSRESLAGSTQKVLNTLVGDLRLE